ncbi:sugar phosphate isomerase/epimerase family protein [Listeria fleischmannii]|uniref:Myo-inositol catabolism protein IolH n=2 Tax=Listeria fleischmannii TaxID=1069827 RepID=W7DHK3_9LIST|nr:sugar phosphate isomerase/epimerase [Listeria fleischmannii]EUJ60909.1 myo-inositol catabolism protein IolH [Listeria fleischmannii FSL S10-1203]MBC1399630.1 sugar phosphate isomerase/epimerase [Listeria fleischmannii]MBC1419614.1 sugar phosphate isomerase/epimerase [Listeria fleischmannii]MBC1427973.1 sugar phosphate isomerase/epimerase [Listeria fleischmannii]
MKLAYDPSHFRDNTNLKDTVDHVARLGYEYLELSPRKDFIWFYEYPKVDKQLIADLKLYCRDAGVKISSVLPVQQWSSPNEEERLAAVRNWKRCIEITSELGVDLMNTEFSGDKSQPVQSEAAFLRSMDELIPLFEKEGIKLNLQAHPNDFIETNIGAIRMIRALDKEWIKLVYSVAHAFYYDDGIGDVEAQLEDAKAILAHVLFADTLNHKAGFGLRYIINPPDANVTIHQHLNIGEGEVNFTALFKKLKEIKFDGIATNSVFAYPDRPDWSNDITLSAMKKGLGIK